MHAAVVHRFGAPPTYDHVDLPVAADARHAVVDVLAAALHPRVRSQADGSHYTSTAELPLVPGVDGVGRLPDGTLVYFALEDTVLGSMSEHTVVDLDRTVALPPETDVERVAAAMNPAMSSWVALRRRVPLQPGQSVLVLGATGNAGRLAVQVARRLGAGRVVVAGRGADRLADVGADVVVELTGDDAAERLGAAAADVDVVLDYLWGTPAEAAMVALVVARPDRAAALHWVQIGSVAGPTLSLPSAVLRSSNLRVLGSGQGSVAPRDLFAELVQLAAEISSPRFTLQVRSGALADVEREWTAPASGDRVVLRP